MTLSGHLLRRGSIFLVDELFAPPGNPWQAVSPSLPDSRDQLIREFDHQRGVVASPRLVEPLCSINEGSGDPFSKAR